MTQMQDILPLRGGASNWTWHARAHYQHSHVSTWICHDIYNAVPKLSITVAVLRMTPTPRSMHTYASCAMPTWARPSVPAQQHVLSLSFAPGLLPSAPSVLV